MTITREDPLFIDRRSGLPDELRFLANEYPRAAWPTHRNIGGMASFWLQRHDGFRDMGRVLTQGIADYREGRREAPDFARWFLPRLNAFLGNLDGHHNVEDVHYFPAFAAAERRLQRGFDLLDSDHHVIHEALEANAEAANGFLRALRGDEDRRRYAADRYADANEWLVSMLMRHLDDEEDLIIPLILDRGDVALGGY